MPVNQRIMSRPTMAHFSDPPRWSWPVRVLLALGAGMALALPMLLSGGKPPLRDFLNQAWAWTGWALWALILLYAMRQPLSGSAPRMASPSVWTLWAVWWGVAACMPISGLRGLPWNFVCSALASWRALIQAVNRSASWIGGPEGHFPLAVSTRG
jgi:hypothetical protein